MKKFKFFQKDTQATESFNADTPEGYYGRRRLYHTNPIEYDRLQNVSRRINGGIREERLRRMDETYPEYYHTVGFEFVDVSPIVYSPETFVPQKYMMFRCRNTGVVIQGNLIGPDHPMYNFPDII